MKKYTSFCDRVFICLHNSSVRLNQMFPIFLWPRTPSAFWKISTYPFSISTDEHVLLKWIMTKYLSWIIIDIFQNNHIRAFETNVHWYMYKYLEIKDMQTGAQPGWGAFDPPEIFKKLHNNFEICRNFQRIKMKIYILIIFKKSYWNFSLSCSLFISLHDLSWDRLFDRKFRKWLAFKHKYAGNINLGDSLKCLYF